MPGHVRYSRICLASLLLAVLGAPAQAAEVDLSVNADAARLGVGVPIGNNLLIDGSWLYHSDHGNVVSAGGHVTGAASGVDPLWAGVGLRLSYIKNDRDSEEDGVALGMGGFVRYTLPQYDRISFGGSLYFAPGVLSFGDVDKFYEAGIWAGYSVIKDADVYLGWRKVEADFNDDGSKSMDSGLHIGLRARF
jgi:hypothetical protein